MLLERVIAGQTVERYIRVIEPASATACRCYCRCRPMLGRLVETTVVSTAGIAALKELHHVSVQLGLVVLRAVLLPRPGFHLSGEVDQRTLVEELASDLGLLGMLRFGRDCDWSVMRPLMFVHDAIVIETHPDYADAGSSALKWYMQNQPLQKWFNLRLPIPLIADACIGDDLGLLATGTPATTATAALAIGSVGRRRIAGGAVRGCA